jgi:hypothetical protein
VYRYSLLCAFLWKRITKEHDVGLEDAAALGAPAQHELPLLNCTCRLH